MKKKEGLIPVFDNGHGSLIRNVYQTSGKQSPDWDKGILCEGFFTRIIVNKLIAKLGMARIPFYNLVPELTDVPLYERVERADNITKADRNTYLVSIHFNAGGGTGIEGFTSKGQTESDPICERYLQALKSKLPYIKMRIDSKDGDLDKEKNFAVLWKTKGRSILLELGFMDNESDYALIWDEEYQDMLVDCLFEVAKELYYEV